MNLKAFLAQLACGRGSTITLTPTPSPAPSPTPTPTPTPTPSISGIDRFRFIAFGQNPVLPARPAANWGSPSEAWPEQTEDDTHFATLKSWGIDTIMGCDGAYGDAASGGLNDVKAWDRAAAAANIDTIRRPISQFNSSYGFDGKNTYGISDLPYDLTLPNLVAWQLRDEPEGTVGVTNPALPNFLNAQIQELIDGGVLGQKRLSQNIVGATVNGYVFVNGFEGVPIILSNNNIHFWAADDYPDIYLYPMLYSSGNNGGLGKTTTSQGADLQNFIRTAYNPNTGQQQIVGSAGKPAFTHIWPGRGSSGAGVATQVSTPETFGLQYGSNLINGASSIGLFLDGFDSSKGFQTQCYTQQLPTVLQALKDHIANTKMLLAATEGNVLMNGTNRRSYTLLPGRDTSNDPNQSTPTFTTTPTNGLPDWFEGCDIDVGGGVHYRLVHCMKAGGGLSLNLSGHPVWGTVNMGTFTAGKWKCFKSTAPTTDLCTWNF